MRVSKYDLPKSKTSSFQILQSAKSLRCFLTNSAMGRPSREEPMKRVGLMSMMWLNFYDWKKE